MRTAGGFAPPPSKNSIFRQTTGVRGQSGWRVGLAHNPHTTTGLYNHPWLFVFYILRTYLISFILFLFIYSIYFILHSPTCSIDFFPQPSVLFIFSLTSFHWLATWHLFPGPETWETHKRIHSTIASSDGSLYDWPHLPHWFTGYRYSTSEFHY